MQLDEFVALQLPMPSTRSAGQQYGVLDGQSAPVWQICGSMSQLAAGVHVVVNGVRISPPQQTLPVGQSSGPSQARV